MQAKQRTSLMHEAAVPGGRRQLLIPGGSKSGSALDVDFTTFEKLLSKAIGKRYVQDPATENPPGILTGVPLQ
jgi:hypothetical protein